MQQNDEPDELLDLVNEKDEVVGTIMRGDVQQQGMQTPGLVRASNLFILNSKGEIWVPRRGPHKVIAPNGLDYSAGEHVKAGETYLAAMLRGMQEELNLTVGEAALEYVTKINNQSIGLPYFDTLFIYRTDEVPDYNRADFVSYEWLTPEALLARIKAGEPAKQDIILALEYLLASNK